MTQRSQYRASNSRSVSPPSLTYHPLSPTNPSLPSSLPPCHHSAHDQTASRSAKTITPLDILSGVKSINYGGADMWEGGEGERLVGVLEGELEGTYNPQSGFYLGMSC